MIVLVRCDDRLIHGQSMTVIVKEYKVNNIIVIDAPTASNAILKTIFQKAVPSSMTADVFSVEDAIPSIQTAINDDSRTEVLMKSPMDYIELLNKIKDFPKTLNVGPQSARANTIKVTQAIHILPEEGAALKEAASQGAMIYFQQVPSQQRVDWEQVASKFE
ncbi:MAG: PTS sugar transporter subunit IIB [Peptoniphilaceae bacterium]|nr:PTS sugar transporter subunit IIB [Peptoniphilaceae bacterium]